MTEKATMEDVMFNIQSFHYILIQKGFLHMPRDDFQKALMKETVSNLFMH